MNKMRSDDFTCHKTRACKKGIYFSHDESYLPTCLGRKSGNNTSKVNHAHNETTADDDSQT